MNARISSSVSVRVVPSSSSISACTNPVRRSSCGSLRRISMSSGIMAKASLLISPFSLTIWRFCCPCVGGGAFVDVQALVGELLELLGVPLGVADQRQDHGGRQQPGEVLDVVELVLTLDLVEEVVRQRRDLHLEVGDAARREGPGHELAQLRVVGRIHHDHHRDAVGLLRHDLEHDPVARDERLVVEEPGEHVVVAAQGPEVELLVVIDGRLVAQALPDRVRIGVDLVVVGVVVDVGDRHARGTPRASEYIVSRTAVPACPWHAGSDRRDAMDPVAERPVLATCERQPGDQVRP